MLRKFSAAAALAILVVSVILFACNDQRNQGGGGDGVKTGIPFDTARAARSVISINEAMAFQKSFVSTRSQVSKLINDTSFLTNNFNLPNGEAFSKDALLLLLSQKGADGVRIYYGKDSKGTVRLVLLPVDKDGKVIYTKLIASANSRSASDTNSTAVKARAAGVATEEQAVETGQTCPPCLIDPQQQ